MRASRLGDGNHFAQERAHLARLQQMVHLPEHVREHRIGVEKAHASDINVLRVKGRIVNRAGRILPRSRSKKNHSTSLFERPAAPVKIIGRHHLNHRVHAPTAGLGGAPIGEILIAVVHNYIGAQ